MEKKHQSLGRTTPSAVGPSTTPITNRPLSWASRIRNEFKPTTPSNNTPSSIPNSVIVSDRTTSQDPPEYPNLSWSSSHSNPKNRQSSHIQLSPSATRLCSRNAQKKVIPDNPTNSKPHIALFDRHASRDQVSPYPAGTTQTLNVLQKPSLKWGIKSTKPSAKSFSGTLDSIRIGSKAESTKRTVDKSPVFSNSSFPALSTSNVSRKGIQSSATIATNVSKNKTSKIQQKNQSSKNIVAKTPSVTKRAKTNETKPRNKSSKKSNKTKPSSNSRTIGAFVPTDSKKTQKSKGKESKTILKGSIKTPKSTTTSSNKLSLLDRPLLSLTPRNIEEHENTLFFAKATITQPGKQRVAPRKKMLSSLKKKILKERLVQWKELQVKENETPKEPSSGTLSDSTDRQTSDCCISSDAAVKEVKSCTLSIIGYASADELEDDEEYEEILSNLRDMADEIGKVESVNIPRSSDCEDKDSCIAYVKFVSTLDAKTAKECWDTKVIGGSVLQVNILSENEQNINTTSDSSHLDHTDEEDCENKQEEDVKSYIVAIYGYTSFDELEDDDEYEEILSNLCDMANGIGPVESVNIPRSSDDEENFSCIASVKFISESDAKIAKERWDNMVVSGNTLKVDLISDIGETLIHNHQEINGNNDKNITNYTVAIDGYVNADDLDDDEEYEEILSNLRDMANKIGYVELVSIPRPSEIEENAAYTAYVKFAHYSDAIASIKSWNGMVIGGGALKVNLISDSLQTVQAQQDTMTYTVSIENYVTTDELDDDDEYEEILSNLRDMAYDIGPIESVNIPRDNDACIAYVQFRHEIDARKAIECWDNISIGGTNIRVKIVSSVDIIEDGITTDQSEIQNVQNSSNVVTLHGYATVEDISDDDEYEEVVSNLCDMANEIGPTCKVDISRPSTLNDEDKAECIAYIQFLIIDDAKAATKRWDGMTIGGSTIQANIQEKVSPNNEKNKDSSTNAANGHIEESIPTSNIKSTEKNPPNPEEEHDETKSKPSNKKDSKDEPTEDQPILYSGDKVIPTEYAKCKLVPKVPNIGIRKYAKEAVELKDEIAVPLMCEMLGELMRLQLRSKDDKNAKARRRLVMGLREVARGIRAHQLKMIIMANNLDEYGALDSKLVEILELARENDIPVLFNMNKRKIGKALGKKIKVSVVGIQNADGAYEPFKKIMKLLQKL